MIWILRGDLSRPYVSLGEPTSRYPTLIGQSAVTAWAPVEGTWKNENYGEKCDFFEIAATGGIGCRRRVVQMLPPVAQTGTELVEIGVRGADSVFLMNPMRVVDCLDHGRSDVRVFPSSGRIRGIAEAAFREDLVQDVWLFRIPEMPQFVLATDRFKSWVDLSRFTGAQFDAAHRLG